MQKREFERITANIDINFFCCNTDYSGTVTNLSENGMFISMQKMLFPFESEFKVLIPYKKKVLNILVKISRITKSEDFFDGVGVKLLSPPIQYLELVNELRLDQNSLT